MIKKNEKKRTIHFFIDADMAKKKALQKHLKKSYKTIKNLKTWWKWYVKNHNLKKK